jgi:protocatechuate 3,4-dioxygenase alpha subunit
VTGATTPAQTVGPFFAIALAWPDGPHVVEPGTPEAIRVGGRVLDGKGAPVPDALVETWQADPGGRFDSGFRGFGRCPTDGDGRWAVVTLKPGAVDGQAPHLAVCVFARGLLHRVATRIYFADEAAANAADPLLTSLATADRERLLAAAEPGGYRFDVHLQGPHETTFLSI